MLYRPERVDFKREILVFVHIPKTAGSSLEEALAAHLGQDRYIFTLLEKIGKVHTDRIQKAIYEARRFVRNSTLRLRGIEPLMRKEHRNLDLAQLRVLHGHFMLGHEPKTGRKPIYITLLRDPVDRFLSDYYYRFDIRAGWPEGKKERHAFYLYGVDRFVDYIYARKAWTKTNLQCLYLGGKDTFEAAREAVDKRLFLAAPVSRIGECLELLGPVLNMPSPPPPRANIGRARRGKEPPSEESLAKIREMVSEDRKLLDYVSKAFDDLYAEFRPGAPIAQTRVS